MDGGVDACRAVVSVFPVCVYVRVRVRASVTVHVVVLCLFLCKLDVLWDRRVGEMFAVYTSYPT